MIERISANIDALKDISTEQWRNRLDTDYDGATFEYINDRDYITAFNGFYRKIKQSILSTYGLTSEEELTLPLSAEFKKDVRIVGVLKELLSKLNRDLTLQYLKSFLEEQGMWMNVEEIGQQNKLIMAILLQENLNLERLHLALLVSRYERFGYQDYQMFLDLEGVHDPLKQAEYKEIEQVGINNLIFSEEIVNSVLASYENINETRLSSICLKIINYNAETIVFILRESQRGGLRTLEEYIVGWNADLIVLRFGEGLRTLKARAVDSVKEEVYTTIASSIAKTFDIRLPINYIKSNHSNSLEAIQLLIQILLANNVSGVELCELTLENTPFPGRPKISIQKNSTDILLTQSLNDNTQGYSLASIVNSSIITKMKVMYTTNQRVKHIFHLKLINADNRYFVLFSGQGGGIAKRANLIRLLNDASGVKILEAKEN